VNAEEAMEKWRENPRLRIRMISGFGLSDKQIALMGRDEYLRFVDMVIEEMKKEYAEKHGWEYEPG
jgi:hypothetical protein